MIVEPTATLALGRGQQRRDDRPGLIADHRRVTHGSRHADRSRNPMEPPPSNRQDLVRLVVVPAGSLDLLAVPRLLKTPLAPPTA